MRFRKMFISASIWTCKYYICRNNSLVAGKISVTTAGSRPWFEPKTSRIRSSANHSAAVFDLSNVTAGLLRAFHDGGRCAPSPRHPGTLPCSPCSPCSPCPSFALTFVNYFCSWGCHPWQAELREGTEGGRLVFSTYAVKWKHGDCRQ
jgi:hypothetical protein